MAYDENTPEDTLSVVEALFGVAVVTRFSTRLGGSVVYLSATRPLESTDVVEALGKARTILLAREVGGGQLYVSRRLYHRWRSASILRLRARGLKVATIARRLRIGERQVYNICRRARIAGQAPR